MKNITNFALNIDDETKEQFDSCCNEDFVISASLMPDAHKGYVAPIGSVFRTKNVLVPSWVGYDIGCGMIACKFSKKGIVSLARDNAKDIFDMVNHLVPMGKGKIGKHGDVSEKTKEDFNKILRDFEKGECHSHIHRFLKTQALSHLGSLGSGNHFIELGFEDGNDDDLWLIIHSGSRGVGHKVATHYMKEASGTDENYEKTSILTLDSQKGKEYLNILNFGLEFALLNRLEMAYRVSDVLRSIFEDKSLDFELWVNKNHNHAVNEEGVYVHRKGATPAKVGERGVIPANMRDGVFLVEGLGNEEFLQSSSHGAGRVLSRTSAKEKITMDQFKESMKGIVGKVDLETLDEAPAAYKDINEVMKAQEKSVKVITQIKPIINWKG